MIKVKPNKNVIFTTAVLNINNPKDRKKFSLYEKIADKFEKLIPESFWIEFEKEYKNDNPLAILSRFNILSIYLDDKFVLVLTKEEEKEFIQNKYQRHISFFRNHLKKLYDDIDFDSFYKENIEEDYEKLCEEIQEILDKKPNLLEELVDFWGLEYKPELIFVPNFVALGDCFGPRRGNTFYSLTSSKINKESGEAMYNPTHVYSNTIHELCHSFFKETIEVNYMGEEMEEKLKKLSLNEDILKTYNTRYFEECFVRAATMRLNEILNIYDVDSEALETKVENYLLSNDNFGYFLVRKIYDKLKERKSESLQEIFDFVI